MTSATNAEIQPDAAIWSVVYPAGDLDMAALPELRDLLHPHFLDPSRDVIVDLTHVTFMDCSALGLLMGARARLGGRLWLRSIPPSVAWFLQLTDLHAMITLADGPMHPFRPTLA